MCISVDFRVIEFCFIIDEDCHSVARVEVQDAGLARLPDPRAAADLLHLIEPDGEDHRVTRGSVHVQQEQINSAHWGREPSSVNIQPRAKVYI